MAGGAQRRKGTGGTPSAVRTEAPSSGKGKGGRSNASSLGGRASVPQLLLCGGLLPPLVWLVISHWALIWRVQTGQTREQAVVEGASPEHRLAATIRGRAAVLLAASGDVVGDDGQTVRGLVALERFGAGDAIISVDADLMLSADSLDAALYDAVRASLAEVYGNDLAEDGVDALARKVALPAGLILEQRRARETDVSKKSKLTDYMAMLPTQPPRNVAYFSSAELDALGLFLEEVAAIQQITNYHILHALTTPSGSSKDAVLSGLADAELQKGIALSMSRSLDSQMAPFVDLANHASNDGANAKLVSRPRKAGVALKATRAIARGEEILIDYGTKSAAMMLAVYGFIPSTPSHLSSVVLMELTPGAGAPSTCKDMLSLAFLSTDESKNVFSDDVVKCGAAPAAAKECSRLLESWSCEDPLSEPAALVALRRFVEEQEAEDAASASGPRALLQALLPDLVAVRRCASSATAAT